MHAMSELKDRGNEAYQAGEYARAVQLYTEGIGEEPQNAALFSNRSAAHLKLGDFSKARVDADMAILLDPKWSKGWWRKGTAQMEEQDYKGARQTFKEGLDNCPADKNLTVGLDNANKRIAVVESVQGGGQLDAEFNIDEPSKRSNNPASADTNDGTAGPRDGDAGDSSKGNETASKEASGESKPTESTATDDWPGSAEAEIDRIKRAANHYTVLHVPMDASTAQMKKNYHILARMLHPDRCKLDGASDAMTTVSQAYDTLNNVLKKTLYDQFLSQTGGDTEQPNQTYQEWESRQQPTPLPKWLSFLLGIKGVGYILILLIAIIMLPIVLLFVVVYLLFFLLWRLPYVIVLRIFFPEKYDQMREREKREIAKMEEEAQDRMHAHV